MTEFSIASAAATDGRDQRTGGAWPAASGVLQVPAGFDPDRAWRAVMQHRTTQNETPHPAASSRAQA